MGSKKVMEELYVPMPNNWDYRILYKAGYSTVGASYYYINTGQLLDPSADVWTYIRPGHFRGARQGTKKFLVWRDPVKRFVSLYTDLYYSRDAAHAELAHVFRGLSNMQFQRRYIEHFVLNEQYHTDPHSMRWTDMDNIDVIDTIVLLEDLDDFMEMELGIPKGTIPRRNVSKPVDTSIFMMHTNRIRKYYERDYQWLEANKHKIWKR